MTGQQQAIQRRIEVARRMFCIVVGKSVPAGAICPKVLAALVAQLTASDAGAVDEVIQASHGMVMKARAAGKRAGAAEAAQKLFAARANPHAVWNCQ